MKSETNSGAVGRPNQPVVALALLAALLVILPIEGTAALRNALLAGVLVAFLVHVQQHHKWSEIRFPLKWIWLAYAGIAALNQIWAVDAAYSLNEIKHEIALGALTFWLACNVFRMTQSARWFYGPILLGNTLWVGCSLVIWLTQSGQVDGFVGTYRTGVGNYSTYLTLVLPVAGLAVFCEKWPAWLKGVWLASNLASMFVSLNRQVLLALGGQIVAFAWVKRLWEQRKALLVLGLALLVLLGMLLGQIRYRAALGQSGGAGDPVSVVKIDPRPAVWQFAITEALQHPLSGGGLGRETFKHLYPDDPHTDSVFVHTHNMLINRLVQLGVPGLAVFLCLLLAPLWLMRRHRAADPLWYAVGLSVVVGVLMKNLTDDFFMRELGYLYWLLFGGLLGLQPRVNTLSAGQPIARCLIIRRDNIGDLLCTTPLIHALRERYPAARIDALVNSYNAPVLMGNPDLSHVYFYTKAKHREPGETVLGVFWRRVCLLLNLRRVGYDVVILAGDGNIDRQMGLARWLNAGSVIGFAPEDGQARAGLDVRVDKPVQGHEVERTFSLLKPLGIVGQPGAMILVADAHEAQKAAQALASYPGQKTIAIHISARKIPQRWPVERFAETMRCLHAELGARFMLFWSPGDENNPLHPGDDQKAAALLALLDGLPVLPYPTAHLAELIGGLSQCQSMICADGGAMHIGAALGLPVIALFGNSDAARWHPWEVPHAVLQDESRDVNALSASAVCAAYRGLPT